MSEVYKITNMLVTDEDIINIDKNWQSIVDEYLKVYVREKDQVIAQYIMRKQNEEIERLKELSKVDIQQAQEIIIELKKEIERLGNELQVQIEDNTRLNEYIEAQDKKTQQKESIIKEVREYIKEWQKFPHTNGSTHIELKNLIDILDKENKND